jgi:hypothetical protein
VLVSLFKNANASRASCFCVNPTEDIKENDVHDVSGSVFGSRHARIRTRVEFLSNLNVDGDASHWRCHGNAELRYAADCRYDEVYPWFVGGT